MTNQPRVHPLMYGYMFFIVSWYSAWMTIGDAIWWLALINRVVMWAFLPLPLLLLLAIRRATRRSLLALLPALGIAVLVFGPLLAPHPPPSP